MSIAPCAPSSPVRGVVVFVLDEFVEIYPEFTGVAGAAAQNAFNIATTMLANCCGSVVLDANLRQSLLYMLTAHYLFLNTPCAANKNQPPGIVGRIESAQEGSVSVSSEMPLTLSNAYFMQTKYGAQFWQSTAQYRTARYIAPQQGCAPGFVGAGFPFGNGFPPIN